MKNYINNQDGKLTSGKHISCWLDTMNITGPSFSALKENLTTDIVVVGGGLAGLSVAYCLSQSGFKVVLVEDGNIGSGETGRTTAQLVTALDDRYYHMEKLFGEKDTKLIADSHKHAIDFVEQTILKEKIECDFERVDGYLFLHPSDDKDAVTKEFEAGSRAGLDLSLLESIPGIKGPSAECLRFKNQAQFHPMKYLLGLCTAVVKNGGRLFTQTHASTINHEGITTTDGFTVKANHIVIATNSPVNDKYAMHLKQYAFRSYVIGALIPKNSLQKSLWWDTGDHKVNPTIPPYHYVRIYSYNEDYDLLISGGEDHPIGNTDTDWVPEENRYVLLEQWTRARFDIKEVVYRWSGQVLEPMDSIAFIGRNPWDKENVYIVTGDSGNGMTHCTIAGMLIRDLITGKENPLINIYKPSRFTFKASKPFFKEVIGSIMASLKKEPKHRDAIQLSSIKHGEGKIMDLNEEKCGVYRDENNTIHIVSASCTHLQCTVKWNNDEKSWDCPCHGSRFTYEGKVINGPANTDLPAYSEEIILQEL